MEQIISLHKGYKANKLDFTVLFQNLEIYDLFLYISPDNSSILIKVSLSIFDGRFIYLTHLFPIIIIIDKIDFKTLNNLWKNHNEGEQFFRSDFDKETQCLLHKQELMFFYMIMYQFPRAKFIAEWCFEETLD